jgi:hypothetical protein
MVIGQKSSFGKLFSWFDISALELGYNAQSNFIFKSDSKTEISGFSYDGLNNEFFTRYNLPWRSAVKINYAPNVNIEYLGLTSNYRFSLSYEYHLDDFTVYNSSKQSATYISIGGVLHGRSNFDLGIRAGVGWKHRIFSSMILAVEFDSVYIFNKFQNVKNSIIEIEEVTSSGFANPFYFFPTFSISYTFGPKF